MLLHLCQHHCNLHIGPPTDIKTMVQALNWREANPSRHTHAAINTTHNQVPDTKLLRPMTLHSVPTNLEPADFPRISTISAGLGIRDRYPSRKRYPSSTPQFDTDTTSSFGGGRWLVARIMDSVRRPCVRASASP